MTETPKVMTERFGNVRKILYERRKDIVRWEVNPKGIFLKPSPFFMWKSEGKVLHIRGRLAHPIRAGIGIPLGRRLFQLCPELNRTFARDVAHAKF